LLIHGQRTFWFKFLFELVKFFFCPICSHQAFFYKVVENICPKGVIFYIATPPGLLPASEERPSEWPIERAAAYFEEAASKSTDNRLKSLALYNLGTLMGRESYAVSPVTPRLEMEAALPAAIMRLAEAIRIDPNNEDAKYNLELLEKTSANLERERGAAGKGYAPGIVVKGY